MFIFKKNKKQESKDETLVGTFISFVLTNSNSSNIDMFFKIFLDDWNIEIQEKNISRKDDSIVFDIDGMMVTISFIPVPVPNGEAVENAKTNFRWSEAVSIAKEHKAHIIVAVLKREQSLLKAAELYVKVCASCLKLPNAVALNTLGTLMHPNVYIDFAKMSMIEDNSFPIMNLVFIGVYTTDEGKTHSGYTRGMKMLDKRDIEVLNSNHSAVEVHDFLFNIVSYIIENNAILMDGQTIGFSSEEKLLIRESKGVAIDRQTNTLKIEF